MFLMISFANWRSRFYFRNFHFGLICEQLHHTGTNNFCLWNSPERGWLITAVQDVARPAEGVTNMRVVGGHDVAEALENVWEGCS